MRPNMIYSLYYAIGGGEICIGGELPTHDFYPPFEYIGKLIVKKDGSYSFEGSMFCSLIRYLQDFNDGYTIDMALEFFQDIASSTPL